MPINKPLIVVMPVFNEEANIKRVLDSWTRELELIPEAKILLIDDGSRDGTKNIIETVAANQKNVLIIHQKNTGHGGAILSGYQRALQESEWIFQVDSDDQIPASEFRKLWDHRAESPFILGCRFVRHDPIHRIVISKINRVFIFTLFGVHLKDPNIPFRLMRQDVLNELIAAMAHVLPVFAPNIFLAILAAKRNIPLLDIPVSHKVRQGGTSSLKPWKLIAVCWRCVCEFIKFRRKVIS